ncbi:hypothetical protein FB480_101971 [Agrobacterium vitis]|nr:hypothetical protein FB480_101971 [Agrobacterium vitis]
MTCAGYRLAFKFICVCCATLCRFCNIEYILVPLALGGQKCLFPATNGAQHNYKAKVDL